MGAGVPAMGAIALGVAGVIAWAVLGAALAIDWIHENQEEENERRK